ncbi:hypothetical protein BC332_25113 [Capsicum chinense]|nr:hypothetical protein BC332_25113 [Capsicum chinense]
MYFLILNVSELNDCRLSRKEAAAGVSGGKQLTPEELEKKRFILIEEKELLSSPQPLTIFPASPHNDAQANSNVSKSAKKKSAKKDGGEENPEDFVDPETSLGEKKKLSREMAKTFNPSA